MKLDFINKHVRIKLVYYGPPFSGKTTNILQLESKTPPNSKGAYQVLNCEGDQTVSFDFLDLQHMINQHWNMRVNLFTVPGQPKYATSRRVILRDVDAIVFVADAEKSKLELNLKTLHEMFGFLEENNVDIKKLPYVLQINKLDLPDAISPQVLAKELKIKDEPVFETCAIRGIGVQETYQAVMLQVLTTLQTFSATKMIS